MGETGLGRECLVGYQPCFIRKTEREPSKTSSGRLANYTSGASKHPIPKDEIRWSIRAIIPERLALFNQNINKFSGWWLSPTPLKNDGVKVKREFLKFPTRWKVMFSIHVLIIHQY